MSNFSVQSQVQLFALEIIQAPMSNVSVQSQVQLFAIEIAQTQVSNFSVQSQVVARLHQTGPGKQATTCQQVMPKQKRYIYIYICISIGWFAYLLRLHQLVPDWSTYTCFGKWWFADWLRWGSDWTGMSDWTLIGIRLGFKSDAYVFSGRWFGRI